MLKSFMLFMAVVLLVLTCSSAPVGQAQETSGGKAAAKSTTPAPDSHARRRSCTISTARFAMERMGTARPI